MSIATVAQATVIAVPLILCTGGFVVRYAAKLCSFKSTPSQSGLARVGWITLALSYYAAAMGSWVVSAAPHIGGRAGVIGVVGYGFACALPLLLLTALGPVVLKLSRKADSHNTTISNNPDRRPFLPLDLVSSSLKVYITSVSIFYMWVFLASELQTVGSSMMILADDMPVLRSVTPVAVVAFASLVLQECRTGRNTSPFFGHSIQGITCALLAVFAVSASLHRGAESSSENVHAVPDPDLGASLMCMTTFTISIALAELLNQAEWQRVWASENTAELRKALILASGLIWATVSGFSLVGLIARRVGSHDDPSCDDQGSYNNCTFYGAFSRSMESDILRNLAAVIVVCLAYSTVHALLFAIHGATAGIFSTSCKGSMSRLLVTLIMLMSACAVAITQAIPIVALFLMGNFVAATVSGPFFIGTVSRVKCSLSSAVWTGSIASLLTGLGLCFAFRPFGGSILTPLEDMEHWHSLAIFGSVCLSGLLVTKAIMLASQ